MQLKVTEAKAGERVMDQMPADEGEGHDSAPGRNSRVRTGPFQSGDS